MYVETVTLWLVYVTVVNRKCLTSGVPFNSVPTRKSALKEESSRASGMAHQSKALATKPVYLSSVLGIQMVDREN